jgi:DNA-binding transcriptional ArsR family regulator
VSELAGALPVTRSAVSQQRRVLREHGLVTEEKVGRRRFYHLRAAALRAADDWIRQYEAFWDERLERLRAHLDAEARRAKHSS